MRAPCELRSLFLQSWRLSEICRSCTCTVACGEAVYLFCVLHLTYICVSLRTAGEPIWVGGGSHGRYPGAAITRSEC